jgi:hypothetical protein
MSEFVRENSNIGNRKFANTSLMRSDSKSNSNPSKSNIPRSKSNIERSQSNIERSKSKRSSSKRSSSKRSSSKRSSSKRSKSNSAAVRSFTRKRAQKTIGNFMKKTLAKRKATNARLQAVKSFTEKRARKTIGTFMKKTENKRRSMFLKAVCSDSGVCIAFGKEKKKISDFFNGFTKFDYLKNVKAIGAVSANGFVKELEYEREGYKSYAVLKSSQEKNSDNLMYEFYVGMIVNSLAKQIPCFVETYGLYEYKTDAYRERLKKEKSGLADLSKMLTQHKNYNYGESCANSINQCVLIQHIKGAASIGDKIYKGTPDLDFVMNDFLYAIYQIYFALGGLATIFTHYDLHPDNVILYKPVDGKYIEFHYHLRTQTVSFKSQYIAKMIDYGRSFINQDANKNSVVYYDKVCSEDKCNKSAEHEEDEDEDEDDEEEEEEEEDEGEKCGDKSGYGWMEPPLADWNHYISSSLNNRSHDLRLLHSLWTRMPWHDEPFKSSIRIRNILKNILGKVQYKKTYGTPPVVGKHGSDGKIEDVIDAEFFIKSAILMPDQKKANDDYYNTKTKLGDLHVYIDKYSEFIPA